MNRWMFFYAALVAMFLVLAGCGGSGENPSSFNAAAYEGNYSTAFDRASGTMTLTVGRDGRLSVVIADSAEGNFVGSGATNHVGGFLVTCQGANNKTVTVSGTLRGSGLGRTAAGTVAGTITFNYNAGFTAGPDATLWTNHYQGIWRLGNESGNWFGDVTASGDFSGLLVMTNGDNVTMMGNVFTNGSVSATGTGNGKTYAMQGALRLSPPSHVLGAGILKATAQGTTVTGNWDGHDAVPE